jgi:hypothetical protein
MEKRLIDANALLEKECCGRISGNDVRNAHTIDAVPREDYKRLECELATMKAYMRYMAAELTDPCRFCAHQTQDDGRPRICTPKNGCNFEWRGIPENLVEKMDDTREKE